MRILMIKYGIMIKFYWKNGIQEQVQFSLFCSWNKRKQKNQNKSRGLEN